MSAKVSVIVAAYNVEKYIGDCINSILKQHYTNIEVVIVDDGSVDNTADICDQWSVIDDRIIVIHNEKNIGVSRTRNKALDIASGMYIVFVDGDDMLLPDYLDYMIELMNTTQGDMCLSTNCYHHEEERQVNNDEIVKLSPEEATSLLLSQEVDVGCWNKIYNRDFLNIHSIRFNEDLFYGEGLRFITTVSMKAKVIGCGNKKVYFYRRTNSESATTKFNIDKYRNGWESLLRIKNDVKDPIVLNSLFEHMNLFAINSLLGIIQNNAKAVYNEDYAFWNNYIHSNALAFICNGKIKAKQKVKLLIMIVNPRWLANYTLKTRNRMLNAK